MKLKMRKPTYSCLTAVCILLAGAVQAAAANGPDRPNILVIMADDFGFGSVNAYGAPETLVRTPYLNRLADEGMRFTDANAASSVCSPTRYALLTGKYAWRGPFPFAVHNPYEPAAFTSDYETIASHLQSQGYETAWIGKWHLGYGSLKPGETRVDFTERLYPGANDIGFDYHFGLPQNLDDRLRVWIENDGIYGLRSKRTSPYAKSYYETQYSGYDAPQRVREEAMEFLTKKASDWIRSVHRANPEKPFFLVFSPPGVHHPIVPSEMMRGASGAGAYGDFIQDVDLSVGRLIERLAYEGILNDTLIIFTSDDGGNFPANPSDPENQAREAGLLANGPFRGDKHTIWEGGFRIPLIVRWPGKVEPGTVSDYTVSLVDMFATLSDAIGGQSGPAVELPDSFSFLPTLLGQAQPPRPPLVNANLFGILALRDGPWKYIEGEFPEAMPANHPWRRGGGDQAVRALYNLEEDVAETNNLIDEHPEIADRMQAILDEYRRSGHSRSQL